MTTQSGAPEVIAHRGFQHAHPENTLGALKAAIACGARWLEIDVHLTADRVPVLLHDETLDRVCGVKGFIHQLRSDALRSMRVREVERLGEGQRGEPIAQLWECRDLLRQHRDVRLFVELKLAAMREFGAEGVVERVVGVLRPVLGRCVMISFEEKLLGEARRQGCTIGPVVRTWGERSILERFDPCPSFLFCDIRGLPSAGDLLLDPPTNLAIYEVPDAATARSLHARGVPFVETFDACGVLSGLAPGA